MAGKKIDEDMTQKVIKGREGGRTRKKIAEEFGISISSVDRITKKYLPHNKTQKRIRKDKLARQRKIEEIERRIADLERKILALEARKKS